MKTEEIINYLEEKEGLQIVNQTENEISFVYHDNAANSHTKVFYIEKTDSGFALSHKSEHYRKRYISYNKDLGLLFLDSYVIKYSIFAAISTRWSIEKHEALFHKDELNKVFMITEDQEKYFVGLCVNGRTITFPWKSNYEVAYQKAQRLSSDLVAFLDLIECLKEHEFISDADVDELSEVYFVGTGLIKELALKDDYIKFEPIKDVGSTIDCIKNTEEELNARITDINQTYLDGLLARAKKDQKIKRIGIFIGVFILLVILWRGCNKRSMYYEEYERIRYNDFTREVVPALKAHDIKMEIRYVSEQELRLLEADKDQYAAVIDVLEELGYKCDDSSSYNTGDFSLNKFFPIWQGSNGIYNITVEFLRVPVFSDTSGIPSRSYTCVLIKYRLEEDQ